MPDFCAFVYDVRVTDLLDLRQVGPGTADQVMYAWCEARNVVAAGAIPPASPSDLKRWRELETDVRLAQLAVAMAREREQEAAHV